MAGKNGTDVFSREVRDIQQRMLANWRSDRRVGSTVDGRGLTAPRSPPPASAVATSRPLDLVSPGMASPSDISQSARGGAKLSSSGAAVGGSTTARISSRSATADLLFKLEQSAAAQTARRLSDVRDAELDDDDLPPRDAEAASNVGVAPTEMERDMRSLLEIVKLLSDDRGTAELRALQVLHDDLHRREGVLTERENRVWGWRMLATVREGEMQRELVSIQQREAALSEKEATLLAWEQQLQSREAMLELRTRKVKEDLLSQATGIRADLSRLHLPRSSPRPDQTL